MRAHGLQGVHRRDRRRTTAPDESAPRPPDLVNRQFSPTGQTGCGWPTSPMCAPERSGCTWLLRRTPSPRRIVGWQLAEHLRTDLPLERTGDGAVAMRPRTASAAGTLIHHSDRGCQDVSFRYQADRPGRDRLGRLGRPGRRFK